MYALLRVQPDGGLVKNQERWIAQKRLGDADALALAAGKRADFRPGLVLKVDFAYGLLYGGPGLAQALQRGHVV